VQQELTSATFVGHLPARRIAERVEGRRLTEGYPARPARDERLALLGVDLAVAGTGSFVAGTSWPVAVAVAASTAVAFATAGLYRPRLRYSTLDDLARLLVGVSVVVVLGAWLSMLPPLSAPVLWLALAACAVTGRAVAYTGLYRHRRAAAGTPTLVIGSGDVAIRLAEVLRADRRYGLRPIGLVGPPPVRDPQPPAPLLGPVDDLDAVIAETEPHAVIVAFPGLPDVDLVSTLRRCRRLGVAVYVVPRLFELALGRGGAELVCGIPLVRMQPDPPRRWRGAVKRAIDIAGALLGLVVLSPVLAICALAVRWESGRADIVFRQERIGKDGKPFTILKFRSLTPSSEGESQMRWNIGADSRVGPVGRLLRATSLDELPQLLNVLCGEMSLVGPRPERPYFVAEFQRTYDGYADRHRVLGGITGWAQIHGLRGDTSIEDRVRFDNYYVENWSLALDLKIILRTFGSMLGGR
jgi:exopolysaccharide biosynthesis polyprenyl glycosylphosphotransferase